MNQIFYIKKDKTSWAYSTCAGNGVDSLAKVFDDGAGASLHRQDAGNLENLVLKNQKFKEIGEIYVRICLYGKDKHFFSILRGGVIPHLPV